MMNRRLVAPLCFLSLLHLSLSCGCEKSILDPPVGERGSFIFTEGDRGILYFIWSLPHWPYTAPQGMGVVWIKNDSTFLVYGNEHGGRSAYLDPQYPQSKVSMDKESFERGLALLYINDVQLSDAGNYTCLFFGPGILNMWEAEVKVMARPLDMDGDCPTF